MNIKNIRALVQLLEHSNLTVLEVAEADVKIRLEKEPSHAERPTREAMPAPQEAKPQADGAVDFNRITEVKSPMVGVFYAAPAPGTPPYVAVGSHVKKGDVLCVIEAMKLMNEITAELDGEIVDILAENGQVVEYGQSLFKVF